MESLTMVLYVATLRYALHVIGGHIKSGKRWFLGSMFIVAVLGGVLPIILLKEGFLSSSPVNILIAVFCFFYMALAVGKTVR